MQVRHIDHVQLAMPAGREDEARAFYRDVLQIPEVAKPSHPAARGGCWFERGQLKVHLGVEENFVPARKAHPALIVEGLRELATCLQRTGYHVWKDQPLEGYDRLYVDDPFRQSDRVDGAEDLIRLSRREEPMVEKEVVLGLAAEIISAHVRNNAVPTDQLPTLIQQVFNTLVTAEQKSVAPPRPEPAVPIKQSMRADYLTCLDCGKRFSMLKRHLRMDHQLTPQQYRQRWALPVSYPMVASGYAKVRSAIAKNIGLGRIGPERRKKGRGSSRG